MDVEVIAKMPGFAAGKYGPVAICCWDSPPTEDHAQHAVSALAATARAEDKMFTLAIVGKDTPAPDGFVRDVVGKEMTRISRNIVGAATVVEGVGFRAAAIRGALTGMALVMRPSYFQKVCITVDEAAEFLAGHSNRRITASGLVSGVLQLRA